MVNLQAVFIANAIGAALMLVLIINNRINMRNVFLDERLFSLMPYLTLVQCAVETLSFVVDGRSFPGAHVLLVISNVTLYVVNISFAFVWTMYADYKVFEDLHRLRRRYPFVAIPALVVIVMSLLNLFTDVFFTVSPQNVYERTSLYLIPYAVTYGYLMYGAVLVLRSARRAKKYLFLPVATFLTPVFLGSLAQLLCYGISLVWPSVAVGVISLYINLQAEASSVDSLTGLYNRQWFSRYLAAAQQRGDEPIVGVLLDVDMFKQINDTYGHLTGDQALYDAGQLLRSCSGPRTVTVRYGGDEFVMLSPLSECGSPVELRDAIHTALVQFNAAHDRPYRLSLSMGSAVFQPGAQTIDEFLAQMDGDMYAQKRAARV